jgi:hypothetical protein
MKSIELTNHKGKSLLAILRDDDTVQQYCIATNYKANRKFGEQWDSGSYSFSFDEIMKQWHEYVNTIYDEDKS